MWHEARKQEKQLRNTMIDQSKRAERKRKYFENIRKDPEQFMQIHGRRSCIHTDLCIAKAAEDSNILRPWQGDPTITIDRFDVRSHLSKMDLLDDDNLGNPKYNDKIIDEKEELVCEFERYRILIINNYKGVSEKTYLKKISEREYWLTDRDNSKKVEAEKKKKSADKKSNIGFSYDDSEVVGGKNVPSDNESDEEIAEIEDLDVDLNTAAMNAECQRQANKFGEEFGIKRSLFCALLKADQQAQRDAAQLKQIDRQKAQLSGKDAKHERMLLRQQRQAIVGKGCAGNDEGATATLLGFINNSNKKSKVDEIMEESDKSDNEDDKVQAEFITTFGGEEEQDSDNDVKKDSVGPELPSEQYRKLLSLSRKQNEEDTVDWGEMKFRKRSETRSRSRDRARYRRRTRTPPNRSRSRTRSRDRYKKRRTRSRDKRRRSRTRSRSRDHNYGRSREKSSKRSSNSKQRISPKRRSRSTSQNRTSEKISKPNFEKKVLPLPEKNIEKNVIEDEEELEEESIKMIEIRSSMSESEKERIEIENRKRRIRLTKKMVKEKKKTEESSDEDEIQKKHLEMAKKVKDKMNEALKKTRDELAKEEKEKKREAEVKKRVQEELRYIEEQERREREKAKRRARSRSRSR